MSVAVLGAGAFGTALAIALAQAGREVTLWGRDAEALDTMAHSRRSPRLPGVVLPDTLSFCPKLETVCASETLLLATPAQSLGALLDSIQAPLDGTCLVACCKGIDLTSGTGPSGVIAARKPGSVPAVLTGPSFAVDIASGLPTALTLACADAGAGPRLQRMLSTRTLRLYLSPDLIGAELGGALKNVIAIACGACIGAGLGDSARAALMTRGFAEMQRIAAAFGADPATLTGLSGLGDLALTCTSDLSRNYRLGVALGRGRAFDQGVTVEGAATARAAVQIARARHLDLPICGTVADLCDGLLDVPEALSALLSRPLREE